MIIYHIIKFLYRLFLFCINYLADEFLFFLLNFDKSMKTLAKLGYKIATEREKARYYYVELETVKNLPRKELKDNPILELFVVTDFNNLKEGFTTIEDAQLFKQKINTKLLTEPRQTIGYAYLTFGKDHAHYDILKEQPKPTVIL